MYTCTYICVSESLLGCWCVHISVLYIHKYMCKYMYIYIHTYMCEYVYICTHLNVSTYAYAYVCVLEWLLSVLVCEIQTENLLSYK